MSGSALTGIMAAHIFMLSSLIIKPGDNGTTSAPAKNFRGDIEVMNALPATHPRTPSGASILIELFKTATTPTFTFNHGVRLIRSAVISCGPVIGSMISVCFIYFNIFWAIIRSHTVYVVNDFSLNEKATKFSFGHNPVFIYISGVVCRWMVWNVNHKISVTFSHFLNLLCSYSTTLIIKKQQLYSDETGKRDPEWGKFQREWARPAIIYSRL